MHDITRFEERFWLLRNRNNILIITYNLTPGRKSGHWQNLKQTLHTPLTKNLHVIQGFPVYCCLKDLSRLLFFL